MLIKFILTKNDSDGNVLVCKERVESLLMFFLFPGLLVSHCCHFSISIKLLCFRCLNLSMCKLFTCSGFKSLITCLFTKKCHKIYFDLFVYHLQVHSWHYKYEPALQRACKHVPCSSCYHLLADRACYLLSEIKCSHNVTITVFHENHFLKSPHPPQNTHTHTHLQGRCSDLNHEES